MPGARPREAEGPWRRDCQGLSVSFLTTSTKYHGLVLKQQTFISIILEAIQDQDASTVGLWWKLSSWLTDSCLTESSHAGERVSFAFQAHHGGSKSHDPMEI